MASTTTNLHLKLLGTSLQDKETYFEEWRQDISGENNDSNMNIIDRAYKSLADDIESIEDTGVTGVDYDTSNKKFTKTIDGSTSDVVSTSQLKSDMSLDAVENKSSADIRGELTSTNVTDALGFTPVDESDAITNAQIDALFA